MHGGVQGLDACFRRVSGKPLKGGSIVVIQTHGRHGQYTPPLPIIATSGGWAQPARQWVPLDYVPYRMLRQQWQWSLLTMRRQTVQTQEMKRLVDACYTRYREGFVTNVQQGAGPSRYQSLAADVAKHVVSPPISVRRLDRDDGQRVPYHYRSHKSERVERDTVDVSIFIGRLMQQVFPQGFQRRRAYGVQAAQTFAKLKGLMQEALAKVQGIVKGAIKIIAPLLYRQRYQQRTGRDPVRCPREMGVGRIWHPTSGLIQDELKAIARGKEASQAPRAAPAGSPGRTVWPASGGISLSLPGLQ